MHCARNAARLLTFSSDLVFDGARASPYLEQHAPAPLALRLPEQRIVPCRFAELGLPAPRPLYSVLASERGCVMPTLDEAIERYVEARARVGAEARA